MARIDKRQHEGADVWRAQYRTPEGRNATEASRANSMQNLS
jgi:hypothetical protein